MSKANLQSPYACPEGINSSKGIAPLHHGTSHAEPWLAQAPAALPPRKGPQCPHGNRQGGPLSTSGRSVVKTMLLLPEIETQRAETLYRIRYPGCISKEKHDIFEGIRRSELTGYINCLTG
jgi:hypothetical protein